MQGDKPETGDLMPATHKDTPSQSGSELVFAARNRQFEAGERKYWYDGDPAVSAYYNALSALFPPGETFFCDTLRYFRDQIADPKLQAEVKEFIAQESIHAREHHTYNKRIAAQGYPMEKLERRSSQLQNLARILLPKKAQLGLTIALEHFTAILSDCLLNVREDFARHTEPKDYEFWIWHSVEETEHKAVAYDVLKAITSPPVFYFLRVFSLIVSTISFNAILILHIHELLKTDRLQWSASAWGRIFRYVWVDPGAWRVSIPAYLDWFRPGFHPWQHDNRELVAAWKKENGEEPAHTAAAKISAA